MQLYTTFQNTALLIVRLIVAAIFLYAAYAKLPLWSGTPGDISVELVYILRFLTIVEPLGALALIFGFSTRIAAAGLAIIMVGAILVTQFVMNVGFATPQGAGWNFPLAVLAGCFALMAFGAGRWAVDAGRSGFGNVTRP